MSPTFSLLTLAVLALWVAGDEFAPWWRRHLWLMILGASAATALVDGYVKPVGLLALVALGFAAFDFSQRHHPRWRHGIGAAAIALLSLALMTHQMPGFDNPRAIFAVKFTPDAIPYSVYLNFDKTVAGLLILGWGHARINRLADWGKMLRLAVPGAFGVVLVIMVLSLGAGYVRYAPKIPDETWTWLWVNLCFTCFAEEAIFRGFVQGELQRIWRFLPGGRWLALVIGAGLFGLAHAAGGATYVALATVAGAGYGLLYQRTQRIEASIIAHFTLNVVHFFFFTYPVLQNRS